MLYLDAGFNVFNYYNYSLLWQQASLFFALQLLLRILPKMIFDRNSCELSQLAKIVNKHEMK